MNRLIVAFLAAVDAAIAAAVGLAATLAPLTLLWVLGLGGGADWSALWPAAAVVWQLGDLVPFTITLPGPYVAASGVDPEAASFALSLAPLAFAAFTAVFAARSGVRASRAGAWGSGVATGVAVFALAATFTAVTSANDIAAAPMGLAVLAPTLVYAIPAFVGAVVAEWCEAEAGVIARVRDAVQARPHGWGGVIGLATRGGAIAVVALIGAGALLTGVAVILGGTEIIALSQAGNVDALGATMITLGQLAYLPTMIVWAVAFLAGPGFSLGAGTAISPVGTQVGVVPGIPVLGALPETLSSWLLLLALVPVACGAFAGWVARSRLVRSTADGDRSGPGTRAAIAGGITILAAGAAGALAALASGSIGPGSLAAVGPEPGPVALAVGLEVALGAGILLLSPLRGDDDVRGDGDVRGDDEEDGADMRSTADDDHVVGDEHVAADVADAHADVQPTLDLGPRRSDSGASVD